MPGASPAASESAIFYGKGLTYDYHQLPRERLNVSAIRSIWLQTLENMIHNPQIYKNTPRRDLLFSMRSVQPEPELLKGWTQEWLQNTFGQGLVHAIDATETLQELWHALRAGIKDQRKKD